MRVVLPWSMWPIVPTLRAVLSAQMSSLAMLFLPTSLLLDACGELKLVTTQR